MKEKLSYFTVLSNWLLGYDKYKNCYSKELIKESKYHDVFYLLKEKELDIGIKKAKDLLNKINNKNILNQDRIIKINTLVDNNYFFKNERNGLGWFVKRNYILVDSVEIYNNDNSSFVEISIEELNALSYKLKNDNIYDYKNLKPLTLSFLPVGYACQASCSFCFSKTSISKEKIKTLKNFKNLEKWFEKSKNFGANRFVITGGGEPSLIGIDNIKKIIEKSRKYFNKNILITNGLFLHKNTEEQLKELKKSGLDVLAISHHHFNNKKNNKIMGIKEDQDLIKKLKNVNIEDRPMLRLVCVLQKGAIDSEKKIKKYINFAIDNNIEQICFKELYVSSTNESKYSGSNENLYARKNQVKLSLLNNFLIKKNSELINRLPWGSPVYKYKKNNKSIDIAVYTEPSVGWEKFNGVARSWNLMNDEKCYASLEDINSEIFI